MDSKSEKPLRLFVNPFTIWTDLAFKTGQAMWASAHAAALRSTSAVKVAVIPTADAPAPNAQEAAKPVLPPADAPRKPRAAVAQLSKVGRFKAARAKLRSKASTRRRPSAKGARARARH
jgi:hypothetical protein